MVNEKWMVESLLYLLEHQGGGGTATFASLGGYPRDNTRLKDELNNKVDNGTPDKVYKIGVDSIGMYIEY